MRSVSYSTTAVLVSVCGPFSCTNIVVLNYLCGSLSCTAIVVPISVWSSFSHSIAAALLPLCSPFSCRSIVLESLRGPFSCKNCCPRSLCLPFLSFSITLSFLNAIPSYVALLLSLFLYAVRSHLRVLSPFHYAVRSHVRVFCPCVFLPPCIVTVSVQTYEYWQWSFLPP